MLNVSPQENKQKQNKLESISDLASTLGENGDRIFEITPNSSYYLLLALYSEFILRGAMKTI